MQLHNIAPGRRETDFTKTLEPSKLRLALELKLQIDPTDGYLLAA